MFVEEERHRKEEATNRESNILTAPPALRHFWMFDTSTRKTRDKEIKKKKKRTEFKVSPVFQSPKVLVHKTSHTVLQHSDVALVWEEEALAYQRSPFCSSEACSQGGRSIQIHPGCSHNPARSRHCSRCIHLYLRGKWGKHHDTQSIHFPALRWSTQSSFCAHSPPQWASPYMV